MAKARQDLVSLIPGEVDTSVKPTVPDEPYSLKDLIYFFPDLLIGGGQDFAASVLGTGKGIAEGIASENYGTQEGVREAEKSALDFMQKYGAKPKSRAASDFKRSIAELLTDTGLDKAAIMDPRLFTSPLPGPASTRFATVKSAKAVDDVLEDQYRKQAEGEGGQAAQMLRSVLPPRLDIFQGAKSQTFDKKSAEIFEKAEKEIFKKSIMDAEELTRQELNKRAWQKTVDAVKKGEVKYPTFRGVDNEIRQEVPDTGFSFKLPLSMVGVTGPMTYPKNFEKVKKGELSEISYLTDVQLGFNPQKMILKEVDKGRNFYVLDAGEYFNYKDIDFDKPISNKDMVYLLKNRPDVFKKINLDKLIDFPDLFEAYKKITKHDNKTATPPINIQFVDDVDVDVTGSYNPGLQALEVTPKRMLTGLVGGEKYTTPEDIRQATLDYSKEIEARGKPPTAEQQKKFKQKIKTLEKRGAGLQKKFFRQQEQAKNRALKDYKNTILHEVQHAIQEIEGFGRGTNTKTSTYNLRQLLVALDEKRKQIPQKIKSTKQNIRSFRSEEKKQKYTNELRKLEEQKKVLDDLYANFQSYLRTKTNEEVYKLSSGEAEARLVEKRKNLSMEERLNKFPLDDLDRPYQELFPSTTIPDKDLLDDFPELFESYKKNFQKQVDNFIIQQLSPRQARDLGFDKD